MSSAERVVDLLGLFTPSHPVWSPERAASTLGVSRASAYRYFALLSRAGLVESTGAGGFALGPAIVELDRQIRLGDPLLRAARDPMDELARHTGGMVLLSRLHRDRVMCIHQSGAGGRAALPVSYERGRAMPLHRSATSKAILAYLPPRELVRRLEEAGAPGALRAELQRIREDGLCTTRGEVDRGALGIAVPLFEPSGGAEPPVTGSLSVVLAREAIDEAAALRATRQLRLAAGRVQERLERQAAAGRKPRRRANKEART